MGSYTTFDFIESLNTAGIDAKNVKRVISAWGDYGEVDEWSGGFLLEFNNGIFGYLRGYCDTSGWGCQDFAEVTYFCSEPTLKNLIEEEDELYWDIDWDINPADLNLFITKGDIE